LRDALVVLDDAVLAWLAAVGASNVLVARFFAGFVETPVSSSSLLAFRFVDALFCVRFLVAV
jgi:hypothetical protein